MEEQAYEYFHQIDELGGMVEAVKRRFPQREIADAAFRYQQELESGLRKVVSVNCYTEGDDAETATLKIDPAFETDQVQRLREVRERRDAKATAAAVRTLQDAAREPEENLMAPCSTPLAPTRPRAGWSRRCSACSGPTRRRRRSEHARARVAHYNPAPPGRIRYVTAPVPMASSQEKKIRVVVAKPGLDGHDRGAKIIARALRDAGMEVIYTGLHQTPEQIVETVIQEDADAVGLSILSGAHLTLVPRILELPLREQGVDDVVITVGGTIPSDDVKTLKELGVAEVFTPGASTRQAIDFIRSAVRA